MAGQSVNVKQVNVYLAQAQHRKLQKLKEETGTPHSFSSLSVVDSRKLSSGRRKLR